MLRLRGHLLQELALVWVLRYKGRIERAALVFALLADVCIRKGSHIRVTD